MENIGLHYHLAITFWMREDDGPKVTSAPNRNRLRLSQIRLRGSIWILIPAFGDVLRFCLANIVSGVANFSGQTLQKYNVKSVDVLLVILTNYASLFRGSHSKLQPEQPELQP
jgi:hypothetical protein